MLKLFVIDDHYLIIKGLYQSFDLGSDEFQVVGSSLNISEAQNQISLAGPDIIILDLFVGHTNPITNFKLLHGTFPSIPIIILSQEDSINWQLEMFRLGARAYLRKDNSIEEMRQVIRLVSEGNSVIPEEIASRQNYSVSSVEKALNRIRKFYNARTNIRTCW